MKYIVTLTCLLLSLSSHAARIVNVYVWGGEIPRTLVHQFENKTGIHVNLSTYDSNETMYAKLKASHINQYDVILPSSYYVEKMKHQGLLTPLDKHALPNLKNLDSLFTHATFDPDNQYSAPLTWGATGIFYNAKWIKNPPLSWADFWDKRWHNQLLLLDDARDVFSFAQMRLGYLPNDRKPQTIRAAFESLVALIPNIKLFASDSVQAILIDEDALVGSVWNGDVFKAYQENPSLRFVFPEEGFVLWADCLAIPKNPPHLKEAYEFINFLLEPESAASIAVNEGHAITNVKGKALLPERIRNNPWVYPSQKLLKRGHFQREVSDQVTALINHYWEQFKLAF